MTNFEPSVATPWFSQGYRACRSVAAGRAGRLGGGWRTLERAGDQDPLAAPCCARACSIISFFIS
jgi:hypothetical protein